MQNRLTHLIVIAWAALMPPIATAAQPEFSAPVPAVYEFNWKQAGDSGISPVQIFDNGKRVYLQFAPGTEIPAIFADAPGGRILLAWEAQSPYIVVPHMEARLAFRLGKREAVAWRAGIPPEGSYTGLATPARQTGSAAVPATREQLAFRRTAADAAAGPDPSYKPIVAPAPALQATAQPLVASMPDGSSLAAFMGVALGGPIAEPKRETAAPELTSLRQVAPLSHPSRPSMSPRPQAPLRPFRRHPPSRSGTPRRVRPFNRRSTAGPKRQGGSPSSGTPISTTSSKSRSRSEANFGMRPMTC